MRLSVFTDPYETYRQYKVFLDGQLQHGVLSADDETGEVVRLVLDDDRIVTNLPLSFFHPSDMKKENVYGEVILQKKSTLGGV
jgi:hypothetical protein